MHVKGTAFLGRVDMLVRELGEDRWTAFFDDYLQKNPSPNIKRNIRATAQIPVDEFIHLNDAVIEKFYGGDPKTYLRFGEASAQWALTEGPYKQLSLSRDYHAFIDRQSTLFGLYYSAGESRATLEGNLVDYEISVPAAYQHVYLEYSPVGYFRRGIELTTGSKMLQTECLKGFSRGDSEVHYRFRLGAINP